jgi:hypothetical protein
MVSNREKRLRALNDLIIGAFCGSKIWKPGEYVQTTLNRRPDLKEQIDQLTSDDTMSERIQWM